MSLISISMNLFNQLVIVICNPVMKCRAPSGNECVVLIFACRFQCCFKQKNWMYLIGIALLMRCSKYQCSVPIKGCIFALISRIPLSDTRMDDLRVKSSNLGVNCTDIH